MPTSPCFFSHSNGGRFLGDVPVPPLLFLFFFTHHVRRLGEMSKPARHIVNALTPLRRGLHLQLPAVMALEDQPLSPRTWHHKRLLHSSPRSLFARPKIKQSPVQKQPQTVDTTSTAPPDNTHGLTVSDKMLMAQLVESAIPHIPMKIPSLDEALQELASRIDYGMSLFPVTRKPWRTIQNLDENDVWRFEASTSDAESIQLHYRQLYNGLSGQSVSMSKLYLRDICQCSECISPSSGQKTFSTCDIPEVPRLCESEPESINISVDENIEITWEDDFLTGGKHTSTYPLDFLSRVETFDGQLYSYPRPSRILWNSAKFRADVESRLVSYSDWSKHLSNNILPLRWKTAISFMGCLTLRQAICN